MLPFLQDVDFDAVYSKQVPVPFIPPVRLPVCLSSYLSVCMAVCLPVCLHINLSAFVSLRLICHNQSITAILMTSVAVTAAAVL